MPISTDNDVCRSCPYHPDGTLFCRIDGRPLNTEKHGSRWLLVFQSPGSIEWRERRPLANTENGAGKRMDDAFKRTGTQRDQFDITNAVQCYQGKGANNRDKKPSDGPEICAPREMKVINHVEQDQLGAHS
jgi:uracil-DNA glycosylase